MRKALAAAVAGILLVPGVLLADDAVPAAPTTPTAAPVPAPPPPTAPPGDGAPAPSPAPAPEQTTEITKPPAPEPKPVPKRGSRAKRPEVRAAASGSVTIRNFAFGPASISVDAGDTVTWTNEDSAPHTATGAGGSFDTGTLEKGHSGSHTFTKPGRFAYICAIHPNMRGTVVVAGSSGGGSRSASPASPSSSPGSPAPPGAAAPAARRPTLPNTGFELLVVGLLGALLAGGGAALRRAIRHLDG